MRNRGGRGNWFVASQEDINELAEVFYVTEKVEPRIASDFEYHGPGEGQLHAPALTALEVLSLRAAWQAAARHGNAGKLRKICKAVGINFRLLENKRKGGVVTYEDIVALQRQFKGAGK